MNTRTYIYKIEFCWAEDLDTIDPEIPEQYRLDEVYDQPDCVLDDHVSSRINDDDDDGLVMEAWDARQVPGAIELEVRGCTELHKEIEAALEKDDTVYSYSKRAAA